MPNLPKPASVAQELHKRKATSISSYCDSHSDSDSDPSPAADSENDASSPSPSLSPSSSTPSQRLTDPSDPINPSEPSIPDADPRLDEHRWTCSEIRAKITRFIKTGEMKVNEFQRAIDVSPKAYYDFMKMSGEMRGQFSSVYDGAHQFFARREILEIRNKNKKKGGEGGGGEGPAKKKAKTAMDDAKYDVSMMVFVSDHGHPMEDDMPIFDTCDGVRRKIRGHLKESGWSQATFAREISKAPFKKDSGGSISTSAVAQFLKKSGPRAGNSSMAFYAAYLYFEKLRVKDEKPKTEFREEMEDIWPGEFDRVVRVVFGIGLVYT
ncbi:hypothetical protein BJX65DRAFT_301981 [Aspergillus insuetus]